jgi:hypothetical protein
MSEGITRFVSDAASWAALGEIAGHLISLTLPGSPLSVETLGLLGALVGFLVALVFYVKSRPDDPGRLIECLGIADLLFLSGHIGQDEYVLRRAECLMKCCD